MADTNEDSKNKKTQEQIEKEERLNKVISVSSEEISYIDRDIEIANNNCEETKDLELQKGITVFTTIANAIERAGEESKGQKKTRFIQNAFEILKGSISNAIKNKFFFVNYNKEKAKENLLNHFKNSNYDNIELNIGGEKKKLHEFVDENFESMCYFFENAYGKKVPSADGLKKLNDYRTTSLYFANGLTEDVLKIAHEATNEEEFCKNMTKKYEEAQKEIKENRELTKDNTKTGVKCALGFGAAGLAVAFPPLIFISAIILLFDTKRDLPFGSVVGAAVDLAKKTIGEIDKDITNQVNETRNEKEKEKKKEFDEVIKDRREHCEKTRKTIGELSNDKFVNNLKDMEITEKDFKNIETALKIGRHQVFDRTINSKKSIDETIEQTHKQQQNQKFSISC